MERLLWFSHIGGVADMMVQQSAHPMDKTHCLDIATTRPERNVP
jgi:hypothetical protein